MGALRPSLRGTLLSTKLAAEALGVGRSRVLALIRRGLLPAEKVGREWLIRSEDLGRLSRRPPGRPRTKVTGALHPLSSDR